MGETRTSEPTYFLLSKTLSDNSAQKGTASLRPAALSLKTKLEPPDLEQVVVEREERPEVVQVGFHLELCERVVAGATLCVSHSDVSRLLRRLAIAFDRQVVRMQVNKAVERCFRHPHALVKPDPYDDTAELLAVLGCAPESEPRIDRWTPCACPVVCIRGDAVPVPRQLTDDSEADRRDRVLPPMFLSDLKNHLRFVGSNLFL